MTMTTLELTMLEHITVSGSIAKLSDRFGESELSAVRPDVMNDLMERGIIGNTMGMYGPVMFFMTDNWRNKLSNSSCQPPTTEVVGLSKAHDGGREITR